MNRFLSRIAMEPLQETVSNPYYRPVKRLRADADAALREMAYVLHLTRRVKASILEDRHERELSGPTAV